MRMILKSGLISIPKRILLVLAITSLEAERIVPLYKRLGAELIGTFGLVFAAVGSDISNTIGNNELGKFAVAVAPGLIIMAMIYGLDKISGAYFNPAISTGFTISKHLKLRDLPLYILVQIFGSIIASVNSPARHRTVW